MKVLFTSHKIKPNLAYHEHRIVQDITDRRPIILRYSLVPPTGSSFDVLAAYIPWLTAQYFISLSQQHSSPSAGGSKIGSLQSLQCSKLHSFQSKPVLQTELCVQWRNQGTSSLNFALFLIEVLCIIWGKERGNDTMHFHLSVPFSKTRALISSFFFDI